MLARAFARSTLSAAFKPRIAAGKLYCQCTYTSLAQKDTRVDIHLPPNCSCVCDSVSMCQLRVDEVYMFAEEIGYQCYSMSSKRDSILLIDRQISDLRLGDPL